MAKADKKRWEEEVRKYNPPEPRQKRRNKTGYNLFFTSHVNKMKENDTGVPGERGSVARVVGNAWKVSCFCHQTVLYFANMSSQLLCLWCRNWPLKIGNILKKRQRK